MPDRLVATAESRWEPVHKGRMHAQVVAQIPDPERVVAASGATLEATMETERFSSWLARSCDGYSSTQGGAATGPLGAGQMVRSPSQCQHEVTP